jgi:hypothetical protein
VGGYDGYAGYDEMMRSEAVVCSRVECNDDGQSKVQLPKLVCQGQIRHAPVNPPTSGPDIE